MIPDEQIPTLGRLARRTIATCVGMVQNRAELLAVELEEENDRMFKLVLSGVIGLFCAMMALILITAIIILLFPVEYRIYAALAFAVLYVIGTVAAALTLKGLLKRTPFSESLTQLRKDAELLDAFK